MSRVRIPSPAPCIHTFRRKQIPLDPVALAREIDTAREIISGAIREFGDGLAILTSFQRDGMVVLDLVLGLAPRTPVLTIDTGRLPASTYDVIADVEKRYRTKVELIVPDPAEVGSMVSLHGRELFLESVANRMLCCQIRKVRPLQRYMTRNPGISAYFVGLRRGQSVTRANVEFIDRSEQPFRISAIADWSADDVARYSIDNALPEHPLYAAGYTSIGCDPCTRAVAAGESERAGRWWWESEADKECGIHFTPDGRAEREVDVLLRDVLTRTGR
jgi:phosphoadenosine phosphosulfate reductase